MNYIKDYIEALKEGKGYDWICNNGYELRKEELIRIIQELDYAIHSICFKRQANEIYKSAAEELIEWYSYYEEEEE